MFNEVKCFMRRQAKLRAWVASPAFGWELRLVLVLLLGMSVATAWAQTVVPDGLTRRSVGSLSVGELAALQRKKMEQDFFKKAGLAPTGQALPAQQAPRPAKPARPALPAKPRYPLALLAVYGPQGQEKAEVAFAGKTHVLAAGARLGPFTLGSVAKGSLQVQAMHSGRMGLHTLRPGETLEVSP